MRLPPIPDPTRLTALVAGFGRAVAAVRGGSDGDDDLRARRDPRGLERGAAVRMTFDGRSVAAFEGESVGAALLAAGIVALRETRFDGRPRGLLCGVGACHDCLVTVDGGGPVRACLTPVADGMRVATHRPGAPTFDPAAVDLRGDDAPLDARLDAPLEGGEGAA